VREGEEAVVELGWSERVKVSSEGKKEGRQEAGETEVEKSRARGRCE
jgi:hypothetical protein